MFSWLSSFRPASQGNEAAEDLSRLCRACAKIFQGKYKAKSVGFAATHRFSQTFEELKVSATREDCQLCSIRWHDLTLQDREALQGCKKITYGLWKSKVGDGISFSYFAVTPPAGGDSSVTVPVLLEPFDGLPPSPIKALLSYSSPTNTLRSYELANLWIHTCTETHTLCNGFLPPLPIRILPAHLLDVGAGSGPELTPRLILTTELPTDTKYMTLSHCWGDYQPLTLTTSRFEEFRESIPWNEIPRTFQEAITVVSKLDVKYLWIDSVCIIQDSDEDWQEQAAIMGDIYRNSHCNLAADIAKDGRDGLFVNKPQRAFRSCKIKAKWRDSSNRVYLCCSFKGLEESWDGPLHERAWVLQEMVLAPRALHFGQQIWWKCLELEASETFPHGARSDKGLKSGIGLDGYSIRLDNLRASSSKYQRYELWQKLVDRYSERALSKPDTDKLVALSSIAKTLIGNGDDYVAGMWKEILSHQLLWKAAWTATDIMPPNTSFPSWSWACLNKKTCTQVPYEFDEHPIMVRILKTHAELRGPDPFGHIEPGAFLCLEGPLVKTTIRRCIGEYNDTKSWLGDVLASVDADRSPYLEGHTVFCLLIEANESRKIYSGIVLERIETVRGQYRRSGHFSIFDSDEERRWFQSFKEMHYNLLQFDEFELVLGVDSGLGLPLYRISII